MRTKSSTQEQKGFQIGDKIRFTDEYLQSIGFNNQDDYPIFREFSKGLDYLTVLDVSNDINPWVWFGQYYKIHKTDRLKENFYSPRVFELYVPLDIKKNVKQLKF